ncbi:MAG: hypothetical protein Q8S33_05750 [Myxococcales bacterium]|nr:hypothetical protein [Myxococcales bacterium]
MNHTLVEADCSAYPGLTSWVQEVLALDPSELAARARALFATGHVVCLLGRALGANVSILPHRSLAQFGAEYVVDPAVVRGRMAQRLHEVVLSLPDGRVSASMVGLLPSDPFVQKDLLLVTHGDSVWASSPTSPTLDEIEQVLMMSAGYPAGLVAAHSGEAWLPSEAALFVLSVFDCETWLWWA